MTDYQTIAAPHEASLTEKRSEFIAQLFPAQTAEEAAPARNAPTWRQGQLRSTVWHSARSIPQTPIIRR